MLSSSPDPAPSALLPRRRAIQPVPAALPLHPWGQQGGRGFLPPVQVCGTAPPSVACLPSPETSCASSCTASSPTSHGRQVWQAVKRTAAHLLVLCCPSLPAWQKPRGHRNKVVPMSPCMFGEDP